MRNAPVPEWHDAVFAQNQQLWAAVALMFQIMRKGGLILTEERRRQLRLGDEKADPLADSETIGIYVADLSAMGINENDVAKYSHDVRRRLRFFPTASELARAFAAVKYENENPGVIESPVYVYQDGAVRMIPRAVADAKGQDHYQYEIECQIAHGLREPMKALPKGTSKDPRTLVERLTGSVLNKKAGPA